MNKEFLEDDGTEPHAADCPSRHCGECLCGVADRNMDDDTPAAEPLPEPVTTFHTFIVDVREFRSALDLAVTEKKTTIPVLTPDVSEIVAGFNSSYVLDVLKIAGKSPVVLSMKDNQHAGVFTIPSLNDYQYVLMPMRV